MLARKTENRGDNLRDVLAKWADPQNPAPRAHNAISTAFLRGLHGYPRTLAAPGSDAEKAFRAGAKRRAAEAKLAK